MHNGNAESWSIRNHSILPYIVLFYLHQPSRRCHPTQFYKTPRVYAVILFLSSPIRSAHLSRPRLLHFQILSLQIYLCSLHRYPPTHSRHCFTRAYGLTSLKITRSDSLISSLPFPGTPLFVFPVSIRTYILTCQPFSFYKNTFLLPVAPFFPLVSLSLTPFYSSVTPTARHDEPRESFECARDSSSIRLSSFDGFFRPLSIFPPLRPPPQIYDGQVRTLKTVIPKKFPSSRAELV